MCTRLDYDYNTHDNNHDFISVILFSASACLYSISNRQTIVYHSDQIEIILCGLHCSCYQIHYHHSIVLQQTNKNHAYVLV